MKRFQFRLEQLLKVKEQLERLAEQRQQQARMAHEAVLEAVARAEGRVLAAGSGGLDALRQAATLGAWQARYEQVAALGQLVTAAQAQAQACQKQVEAANQVRVRIASEVEALKHLRRQQWQTHQEGEARHAQEELDEVGVRRWLASRARAGDDGDSFQEEVG